MTSNVFWPFLTYLPTYLPTFLASPLPSPYNGRHYYYYYFTALLTYDLLKDIKCTAVSIFSAMWHILHGSSHASWGVRKRRGFLMVWEKGKKIMDVPLEQVPWLNQFWCSYLNDAFIALKASVFPIWQ